MAEQITEADFEQMRLVRVTANSKSGEWVRSDEKYASLQHKHKSKSLPSARPRPTQLRGRHTAAKMAYIVRLPRP